MFDAASCWEHFKTGTRFANVCFAYEHLKEAETAGTKKLKTSFSNTFMCTWKRLHWFIYLYMFCLYYPSPCLYVCLLSHSLTWSRAFNISDKGDLKRKKKRLSQNPQPLVLTLLLKWPLPGSSPSEGSLNNWLKILNLNMWYTVLKHVPCFFYQPY